MNDQDWMQDMFTRSRREAEPVWTPDTEAIAVGGRRRRRLRAVSVGGGALGAVAVTTAVVIGLGGITGGPGASPVTPTPRSTSVFEYATLSLSGAGDVQSDVVPVSAVGKLSALIDLLDPDHAHLRSMSPGPYSPKYRTVGDGNSAVKKITSITATSVYTPDGTVPARETQAPNGSLSVMIAANATELGRSTLGSPDVSTPGTNLPCGYALRDAFQSTPPDHASHWSKCTSTPLSDGSKVDTSSTPDGEGTVTVAIREYPNNGGGVVAVWTDYANWRTTLGDPLLMDKTPDSAVVLKPNPITEQQLAAAVSDPDLGPTTTPKPVGSGPKQFLKTGDLGADAAYDPSSSSGSTGDLPMDNGCDYKDVNPLAKPGRTASYTATTPGGTKARISEMEYPLPPGSGHTTMATARTQANGGCDQQTQLYSKDVAKDLPSVIGDESFIEYGTGTGAVTLWTRFGDTILRVDITQGQAMPDLSGTADQAWLLKVAHATAAHWTAKD